MSASRLKVVVALGTTQTLAFGSTYYLPAILAAPMAKTLGLGVDFVYAAFSVALLVSGLLGPVVGRRIDLLGGRGVLAASSLTFALGLGLLAAASGPVLLLLAWLVIGVGMAMGLYEAGFATLAGIYGSEARGPITGITLIAGFASTVAWPVSALLEGSVGWRGACLFWALVHLLLCLPINRWLVPRGTQPVATVERGTPPLARQPGELRAMIALAFVFAVSWFVSTAYAAHLPGLLLAAGLTPAMALFAATLVGPAQVAARLVEFGLLRRYHPLVSARLATLAHPLGAAALLALGSPAAIPFALLHGAGNGILTIAKGTLPLVLFGPAGYGLRQGLITAPSRIAQAAAPLLMALAIERLGLYVLAVSSGLLLLACLVLLRVPRSLGKPCRQVASTRRRPDCGRRR